ncbi:hypothetical protein [Nonomuraea sp. NPDC049400]|uniref:hypothetical protein n=1 Tax=Nonomuraea sp. NPDC049400 TaxID=3364352 RepID=UPI003795A0DC
MKVAVLPRAYRHAVEIMVDAGRALRARQIAVGMGLPDEAAKREGLRSKLKRLVERGWAREEGPGLFTVTEPVVREVAGLWPARTPWLKTGCVPARRWACATCPARAGRGWILAANLGHDLDCWLRLLILHDQDGLEHAEPDTMRYRLYHLPALA